jgi:hypothetical protein
MTAIAAVLTPEGYILSADGRQAQGASINDETVKIFHSSTRNSAVAWGCYGAVEHSFTVSDSFDLAVTSLAASKQIATCDFSSLEEYAMKMADCIHYVLSFYYLKYSSITDFSEDCFPGLVFVGYVNGKAEQVKVEIRHRDRRWLEPSLPAFPVHPSGLAIGFGPQVTDYPKAGELHLPKTLDEGKRLTEGYIQLCIDALGKDGPIGGRIHSALVTPKGFEWVTKPKAVEE